MAQKSEINGTIKDPDSGEPIIGANVQIKGTQTGAITNFEGNFKVLAAPEDVLVISYIGYKDQEITVGNQKIINVALQLDVEELEELVVIGYGTMKKTDMTGSVSIANIEIFKDQPNVSVLQSLHGSVAGLNIGQVNQSGQNPDISIRGRTSLSGTQSPLIVMDGVVFRGNIMDINPNDVESVNILKDNSSAAIYGAQAANGVILITTKSGEKGKNKPVLNYSAVYSTRTPAFELEPQSPEEFIQKNIVADLYNGRTAASGYLENDPNYDPSVLFKSNEQVQNYNAGKATDWYDLMTNDNIYLNEQNLSLTSRTEDMNYFISFSFADEKGYMIQEGYKRYNARINIESNISKWLTVGTQSFFTLSDYSGAQGNPADRYIMPYDAAYKWWEGDGTELNPYINGGLSLNPIIKATEDRLRNRNNYFGNIYADLDLSSITKGLSYKINFSNNYSTYREYFFQPFALNFQGNGGKNYSNTHDMSSDNILTYKRIFNEKHNLNVTLVYGAEKRKYDATNSKVSIFADPTLGYNSLETGSAEQRSISSSAWEESSIYNMARIFYSYKYKYMLTGTVRRDGFSGFGANNKFGIFPSMALAWVPTKEAFFPKNEVVNHLKLRLSYGSIGNRTVGRYQTLAKVSGGFSYVDEKGIPLYGKEISSLASPNLKWETTTGINMGVDFGLLNSRINGSVEYYNNNTTDLLYNVDIPAISRYSKYPANLGKLHNSGIEITLSSVNIKKQDFSWNSTFSFSRNRDELKELLGFDNDGDGKEDDLTTSGLFIGEPLNVIYEPEYTREFWQLDETLPSYADYGTYKQVDQNNDGRMDILDNKILGYRDPSYRFSITNELKYKNWLLAIFINSVQGGKNFYYSESETGAGDGGFNGSSTGEQVVGWTFPKYELFSYWKPENPNAEYARLRISRGSIMRYDQRNFIRLQDVSLSYNFNAKLLKKMSIENLRLSLSGKNLLTWTKWAGWDPETGETITRTGRPVLRSYTLGLNLTF